MENEEPYDDEYDDEPCGSCENCGCNLYPEDDFHLCDQCQWLIEEANK